MKKMKKLKKLSLENEMKKEAEQIEKKVREDKSLDDITVSDEMEKELFNKIQDYEYDKRHKKVVRKKKKSKLVIGALAAVLILVCGSVMTSVGSKSYWKVLWERENGDENANIINVENMETKESEDIDEMEADKEITKVMGMYDVLPTLGNMFGFDDPYALGHDIFSTDENVVVFPDGNWLTDKMYYNHQKGEGKVLNEGDTVSIDYIEKYNQISEDVLDVSDSIIVYDLIRKQDETRKLVDDYNK